MFWYILAFENMLNAISNKQGFPWMKMKVINKCIVKCTIKKEHYLF